MLEINNLSVHYGQALALENISLSIPEKGLTAIIGPNGAGKSTMLKAISRLVEPSRGSIVLKNESLVNYGPHDLVRLGIAHCPEGRRVFPEMTVMENLLVGGYILPRTKVSIQLETIFELFPILKERKGQQASTLSGGEQQMMAIARALMAAPSLLLIDEPCLGLSPIMIDVVENTMKNIKESGTSVLIAEGNFDLIQEIAQTVYVFDHGVSVFCGTVPQILSDSKLSQAYFGI